MTTTKNKKRCPACKKHVLRTGYNKNRSTPDGLQSECRECTSERARKKTAENRKIRLELRARAKAVLKRQEESDQAIGMVGLRDRVTKQTEKDAHHDVELRGKDLFLKHLAQYMADADMDYKNIASMVEYSPATVSSYMNGPEKVSEQFIRQVSKKIPHLAGEWYSYRRFTNQAPETEIEGLGKYTKTKSDDDRFILRINGDNWPHAMNEVELTQALNDFMDEKGGYLSDYVLEVFKLVKVGYEMEMKVSHHIDIKDPS